MGNKLKNMKRETTTKASLLLGIFMLGVSNANVMPTTTSTTVSTFTLTHFNYCDYDECGLALDLGDYGWNWPSLTLKAVRQYKECAKSFAKTNANLFTIRSKRSPGDSFIEIRHDRCYLTECEYLVKQGYMNRSEYQKCWKNNVKIMKEEINKYE